MIINYDYYSKNMIICLEYDLEYAFKFKGRQILRVIV